MNLLKEIPPGKYTLPMNLYKVGSSDSTILFITIIVKGATLEEVHQCIANACIEYLHKEYGDVDTRNYYFCYANHALRVIDGNLIIDDPLLWHYLND